ncbi:MAG: hypothetical protein AAGF88_08165 [Pseudomonadota bacterium]
MKIVKGLIGVGCVGLLGACVAATPEGETAILPERVLPVVAPGQDTSTVRILSDGCYWWLYEGVVEDTYIPLETRDGRMICTRGEGVRIDEL